MSTSTRETSRTARFSVWLYSRLLVAYPQPFRREYGAQMVQVFRDCCREATATGGNAGLLRYWLIALGDLIVSALAERRRKELHMTRTFWIRLGSLAAIIGSIGPAVLVTIFLVYYLAPQIPIRLDFPIEVSWLSVAQRVSYVLALVAMGIRGANRTGAFGWAAIALALAGSIIVVVGRILFMSDLIHGASQMLLYSNVILNGSVILPIGIILFGVTALKYRLLPPLNWLPLVVGLTELLSVVAPIIGANIFVLDLTKFSILIYATDLLATVAWILLGIALWPRRNEQPEARNIPASVEPAI